MLDSGVKIFFPGNRHFVEGFAGSGIDGVASLRCWDNLIVDDVSLVGLYVINFNCSWAWSFGSLPRCQASTALR
jgi:hypothetical protein